MNVHAVFDIARIERLLDTVGDAGLDKAVKRALKKTASSARTAAERAIRQTYGYTRAAMGAQWRTDVTGNRRTSVAKLIASGGAVPVHRLGATASKQGVSVTLKGRRVRYPSAFMPFGPSGPVFMRGEYVGGAFLNSKKRLPLSKVLTVGVPVALESRAILPQVIDKAEERWPVVLDQELNYALISLK